jgi:uncharacterized protein (DUF302 family)
MKTLKAFLVLVILMNLQLLTAQEQQHYFFNKILESSFDEVTEKLKLELKSQGFGVISEIDMHTTLKEKMPDIEIKPYKILGVCNPGFAYESIQIEENIGLFLPCKAVIKDIGDGKIEVLIVNPSVIMNMLENEELDFVAREVTEKLKTALNNL